MESKEESKKPKRKKANAVTKDNPGRIKDRPMSHLKKADFLQIQVNLLELDNARLGTQNIVRQIDSHEKDIYILRQKLSEKKAQEQRIKNEHLKFVENLKNKTGIDIRGKSIDFISGEVKNFEDD